MNLSNIYNKGAESLSSMKDTALHYLTHENTVKALIVVVALAYIAHANGIDIGASMHALQGKAITALTSTHIFSTTLSGGEILLGGVIAANILLITALAIIKLHNKSVNKQIEEIRAKHDTKQRELKGRLDNVNRAHRKLKAELAEREAAEAKAKLEKDCREKDERKCKDKIAEIVAERGFCPQPHVSRNGFSAWGAVEPGNPGWTFPKEEWDYYEEVSSSQEPSKWAGTTANYTPDESRWGFGYSREASEVTQPELLHVAPEYKISKEEIATLNFTAEQMAYIQQALQNRNTSWDMDVARNLLLYPYQAITA